MSIRVGHQPILSIINTLTHTDMKRYILTISVIMIALSACKKDAVNKSVTNNKTTHVTFNVGYTQSTGSFHGAVNIGKFKTRNLAVDTTLVKYASVIFV